MSGSRKCCRMEQSHRNTEEGLKIRRLSEFVGVVKVYRLSTIIKHYCCTEACCGSYHKGCQIVSAQHMVKKLQRNEFPLSIIS